MRTFTSPRPALACADKSKLGTRHPPSSAELRTRCHIHPRTPKKGGTTFRTRLCRQIRTGNAAFPLKRRTQNSSRHIHPRTKKKGGTTFRTRLRRQIQTGNATFSSSAELRTRLANHPRTSKKGGTTFRTRLRRQIQTWNATFSSSAELRTRCHIHPRTQKKGRNHIPHALVPTNPNLERDIPTSSAELRTRLAHHPRTSKKGGTTFRTRLCRQIRTWNAAFPLKRLNL